MTFEIQSVIRVVSKNPLPKCVWSGRFFKFIINFHVQKVMEEITTKSLNRRLDFMEFDIS